VRKATLRVRYAETDAMGWVYYATYLCYFEVGRTELIRAVWKPYREIERDGLILPVVEAGCRYYRSVFYDDELEIESRMTFPSEVRVRFDYRIRRAGEEELLAEGHTVHCFVGRDSKVVRVPRELRDAVAR